MTPQQLQASSGQVRCGRCQNLFDAFATLSARFPVSTPARPGVREQASVQIPSPAAAQAGLPAPAAQAGLAAPAEQSGTQGVEPAPLRPEAPGDTGRPAARCEDGDEPGAATVAAQTPAQPVPGDEAHADGPLALDEAPRRIAPSDAVPADIPGGQDDEAPESLTPALQAPMHDDRTPGSEETLHLREDVMSAPQASARPQRRRWVAVNAGLLVLALLQALWVFATPIALALPASRPALDAFCSALGCTVALPQLLDELFIEASDLQMVNPARPNEVLLTATIRNRATVAQQLPLLELTLIAGANQTAARKVLRPEEYLQGRGGADRGIGSNQEVEIRLYLNTGNILPSGYRLFLFFA